MTRQPASTGERIKDIVDHFPPLSETERQRLAEILYPATPVTAEVREKLERLLHDGIEIRRAS